MPQIPLLLSIICLVCTPVDANNSFFTNVVAFGDDNTDTGNVFRLTNRQWPLFPPYNHGRFTDGRVWLENLGVLNVQNYAYIGATTDNDNLVRGYIPLNDMTVPGVRQQILNYLKSTDIGAVDLTQTLYVIWAGANDYLDNANITTDSVVNSLINAVYDLLVVGVTNLVLINQPPLYAYPGFSSVHPNLTLKSRICTHNQILQTNLSIMDLLNNQASIRVFDLYSLINDILIGNTSSTLNIVDQCWRMRDGVLLANCSNPEHYMFIDELHLTSTIHQMIATRFLQFLSSPSIGCRSFPSVFVYIGLSLFLTKLYL